MANKFNELLQYGDYVPYNTKLPLQEMVAMGEIARKRQEQGDKEADELASIFPNLIPAEGHEGLKQKVQRKYAPKMQSVLQMDPASYEAQREMRALKHTIYQDPDISKLVQSKQAYDKGWLPVMNDPRNQGAIYTTPGVFQDNKIIQNEVPYGQLSYVPKADFEKPILDALRLVEHEITGGESWRLRGVRDEATGQIVPGFLGKDGNVHKIKDQDTFKNAVAGLSNSIYREAPEYATYMKAKVGSSLEDITAHVEDLSKVLYSQQHTYSQDVQQLKEEGAGKDEKYGYNAPVYTSYGQYTPNKQLSSILAPTHPGAQTTQYGLFLGNPHESGPTIGERYQKLDEPSRKTVDNIATTLGYTKKGTTWSTEALQNTRKYLENLDNVEKKVANQIQRPKNKETANDEGEKIFDSMESFLIFDPKTRTLIPGSEIKRKAGKPGNVRLTGVFNPDNFITDIIPTESDEQKKLFLRPREISIYNEGTKEAETYIVGENLADFERASGPQNGGKRERDWLQNRITAAKRMSQPVPIDPVNFPGIFVQYDETKQTFKLFKTGNPVPLQEHKNPLELIERMAYDQALAPELTNKGPEYNPLRF